MLHRMAFTSSDLDAIKAAIATGELSVRTSDGRQVTYRDLSDLLQAKAAIEAEIASTSACRHSYPRHRLAVFSD
jgi:hypothetical protein